MIASLSILLIVLLLLIVAISRWKVHPFIALLIAAISLGIALGLGGEATVGVVLKGFSETLRWIAVIVILGAFIGEVLQETSGAFRIASSITSRLREKHLPWAMGFTGYLISIPVFVDVAYILLQPVTESLSVKAKKPVLYMGLSLAAGLTVAHTLIPPTPGPLAVASLLSVDLGRMLMINMIVGLAAMTGGILFAMYFVKDKWLAYDDELRANMNRAKPTLDTAGSSGVWLDLLPILVPILLIGGGAFIDFDKEVWWQSALHFTTLPLVAIGIGAAIALVQITAEEKASTINRLVEQAIVKSALVIMITGAGGAFGYVIKQSGVQEQVVETFSMFPFLGILLPFVVAAVLTTATGSITVSLVGTASMLGPMVDSLPMSPEITAALIGCGAFCVFHANSSFFWLLNRLHKVPAAVLYKTYTLQSLFMGITGLLAVLLLMVLGF